MKRLVYLIAFIAIINILRLIISNREFYLRPFNSKKLGEIYSESQYVKGSGSIGIGDDGLYAFSGYYYITGGDPSQVNFENPPLGKYLIGLSILLFKNENVISLIYGLVTIWVVYALGYELYKDTTKALIGVGWLSFSKVFLSQFIIQFPVQLNVSLLDLPQALFFLLGVYFFIKHPVHKKYFWLSSFFFGVSFASKFFPGLVVCFPVLGIYLWVNKRKSVTHWLLSLVLIPLVYIISYIGYFLYHPSLISFINYQKYMISWRLGNPVVFGNIFRVIFLGTYKNWWDGQMVIDPDWDWKVQIAFMFTLLSLCLNFFEKRDSRQFMLGILSMTFALYIAFDTVGLVKYILPVYPIMIVLSTRTLVRFFDILKRWQNKRSLRQK